MQQIARHPADRAAPIAAQETLEKDLFHSISKLLKQEKVLHKVVDEIQHHENGASKEKAPAMRDHKIGDAASQAVDLN